MRMVVASLGLLLFTACDAGPAFAEIESIKVTRVGSDGLHNVELSSTNERRAVECLYDTREVAAGDAEGQILLQDVYLVEIKDSAGIRSFELYTGKHLKGNKGKYYRSTCIYDIIKA